MKLPRWIATAALLGLTVPILPAMADDQAELIKQLLQRIDSLEKKVNALEHSPGTVATSPAATVPAERFDALEQQFKVLGRQNELAAEAAAEKAKTAPVLSIGASGFQFRSADTNFVLKIKGLAQLDSHWYFNDGGVNNNDSFVLRRARLIAEGTFYKSFEYQFVPEFGGSSPSILDANVSYKYDSWLQVKAGKFKSPVGLEQLQSDANMLFIERAFPSQLTPNRDLGVQVSGDVLDGRLSYAAGVFNGAGDGRNGGNSDIDDEKEFAGRLFAQPFINSNNQWLKGLGFGIGGSIGNEEGVDLTPNNTGFSTDGQQKWFTYKSGIIADGNHWRLSPQAYYYAGPFGLLAEYAISDQQLRSGTNAATFKFDEIDNTGWQVAGSYVITGETPSYKGVTPRHNLNFSEGTWGALELVARYSELGIDPNAFPTFADATANPRRAHAYSVGINYYPNNIFRASIQYTLTDFDGGSGTGNKHSENALLTRFQISF
ncbi:MAG TPA: porin [Candidatus Limnocylindria bacterium]|jgi:phosphate-selective porin OprO/OprP|nr:porin [Candidatus Limnocylindria bacterium]